jgi:dTDP-4-dehydrorhamnose 3,5-epimerase
VPDIDGVRVTPLRRIPDERGAVFHMLRCDDPHFEGFGEIYFSTIWPGAIKGWHVHDRMTLNYAVPVGMIKFVCYDGRDDSPTHGNLVELFLGEQNYALVTVPPGVWNGFKGYGDRAAIDANCATVPLEASEIHRKDKFTPDITYDWSLRHG